MPLLANRYSNIYINLGQRLFSVIDPQDPDCVFYICLKENSWACNGKVCMFKHNTEVNKSKSKYIHAYTTTGVATGGNYLGDDVSRIISRYSEPFLERGEG